MPPALHFPTLNLPYRLYRTLCSAWVKRRLQLPESPEQLFELDGPDSAIPNCPKLPHSPDMKWLDRAAVRSSVTPAAMGDSGGVKAAAMDPHLKAAAGTVQHCTTGPAPEWAASITVSHVQEAKIFLGLIPIMANTLVYQMVNSVMLTLFISQGK